MQIKKYNLLSRLHLNIQGKVQGVGFRPTVYHIAKILNLTGFVFNHHGGVTIEIQGEDACQFKSYLLNHLPPLAQVDTINVSSIPCKFNEEQFLILESVPSEGFATKIASDTCICDDCLEELFYPNSRYYHYPFLNCTNCGPRFTIIQDVPYDRCQTSMAVFPLCANCHQEYSDPENRRYHAQPTACVHCGPALSTTISEIVDRIKKGHILAIKGQGGYQLICDAKNEKAVATLRRRKNREAKPFALMVANVRSAKKWVFCDSSEESLLKSRERPIVLLRKKAELLAPSVAKGLSHLGIMLPYTPFHYLLFHGLSGFPDGLKWLGDDQEVVLVVTSANLSDEPLIIDDLNAKQDLASVADEVISYNRRILIRTDDSVVRVINQVPYFVRRARGYVPECIKLNHVVPNILAVGGHLKNTFCITRGDEAFISQHIGDLDHPKTIQFFHETLNHFLKTLDVKPSYIVHDKHPDFYTTRFAEEYGIPSISVQHHHAHLSSVAAEYHIRGPVVLGLALDGYGYGENGEAWGGELLLLTEGGNYQRLGCLRPLPQIGGDVASKEPWRMAVSVLHILGEDEKALEWFGQDQRVDILISLLQRGRCTTTSSCGRLFDAASAILGIRGYSQYEGQAAMELESLVTEPECLKNGWQFDDENILDLLPLMHYLALMSHEKYLDHKKHIEKHNVGVRGANIFHGTLIAALADWVNYWSKRLKIRTVLLSGGCFLNRILAEQLVALCKKNEIEALLPRKLPPNDGGICLGQAWIAAQKIVF